MTNQTKCLTNNAIFKTSINRWSIGAEVDLPFPLELDEEGAKLLETLIHNQLELVLRPYFDNAPTLPTFEPLGLTGHMVTEWYEHFPPTNLAETIVKNNLPKIIEKVESLRAEYQKDPNYTNASILLGGEKQTLENVIGYLREWLETYLDEEVIEEGKHYPNPDALLNLDRPNIIGIFLACPEGVLEEAFEL